MVSDDPWRLFARSHQRGDRLTSVITRRIDDLGLFVDLTGGIFGIVHLADIDWELPGELAITRYAVGDRVETLILSIDPERQRVSLGIKQLSQGPDQRPPGEAPAPETPGPVTPPPPQPLSQSKTR